MNINEEKIVINGIISRIVYSNNDNGFRVFKVSSKDHNRDITIAGKGTSIRVGETVRAIGSYETTKYGQQLTAESISVQNAVTEDGLAQSICGLVTGLGLVRATNIIRFFGGTEGFVRAFDSNDLPAWPGKSVIPINVFDELCVKWKDTRIEREIESQLASLELTPGIRNKLRAKYGNEAVNIVLTDPYRIPFEVEGIGFLTADDIALKAGVGVNSNKRIDAAMFHAIQNDATESGHTMSSLDDVVKCAVNIFMKRTPPAPFAENPKKACLDSSSRLLDAEEIVAVDVQSIDQFGDYYPDKIYATKYLYEAELKIANGLKRLSDSMSSAPSMERDAEDSKLTDEQNDAVKAVIEKGLTVITGGPGVGKTTTCKAIVDAALKSDLRIKLCAPTARAAKRLNESTNTEATTIHRLLEPQFGGTFIRNAENKIQADLILADEMSMTDSILFSYLLDAIPDGCRLVLVGDHNQLPPVGSGAPFRDIIKTEKINIARLTKIHRQAEGSAIVVGSHSILNGNPPKVSTPGDRSTGCLHMVNVQTADAAKTSIHILMGIKDDLGCDPWDAMVLAPMRKGASGVQEINKQIQDRLNPASDDKPELVYGTNEYERTFRVGDKVRQTKNDYQRGVVNGDLGRIVFVEPRTTLKQDTVLSVDYGQGVGVVNYKRDELSHLQLSYCGTIHSVQGSEAPVVVLILTDAHYVMLTRTLIYTAVTRAKRACIIVGSHRAVAMASKNAKDDGRRTLLSSFLNDCFSTEGIKMAEAASNGMSPQFPQNEEQAEELFLDAHNRDPELIRRNAKLTYEKMLGMAEKLEEKKHAESTIIPIKVNTDATNVSPDEAKGETEKSEIVVKEVAPTIKRKIERAQEVTPPAGYMELPEGLYTWSPDIWGGRPLFGVPSTVIRKTDRPTQIIFVLLAHAFGRNRRGGVVSLPEGSRVIVSAGVAWGPMLPAAEGPEGRPVIWAAPTTIDADTSKIRIANPGDKLHAFETADGGKEYGMTILYDPDPKDPNKPRLITLETVRGA